MDGAARLAEALTQVGMRGQLVVLMLMLGCAGWTVARAGLLPLVGLGLCALMWSRADSRLEGAVLIPITPEHGLVVADLLVPAVTCVALLAFRRRQRRAAAGPKMRSWTVPTPIPTKGARCR